MYPSKYILYIYILHLLNLLTRIYIFDFYLFMPLKFVLIFVNVEH